MDSIDILKSELESLLKDEELRILEISERKGQTDRVDHYVLIIRNVLSSSSLCYIGDRLMFFDGRVYVEITPKRLNIILNNILSSFGVGASDLRKMGDMALSIIWERSFSINENKICFSNCVYDVSSGKVSRFSPKHITDYSLPYSFSKDADCPRWKAFLSEVLPDENERKCLQEFFGMCFIDRNVLSIEKFAIFIGGGSNGKSVVFDVIKSVIGKERVSYLSPEQLQDSKQLVSVIGKKLNFSPDIRKSASFDSALKALSSGQDVQGWKLYAGNVVVKCPPLVFALNEMPRFRDITSAFFRRVLLFSFDVTIPPNRQDKALASYIIANELPGIFKWVMDGRERLLSSKGTFTYSEKINANLERLKRQIRSIESPVLDYIISIGLTIHPSYDGQPITKVPASVIYEGMQGRISKDAITRELTSYGVLRDRSKEVRYYLYKQQ